jgi:hypothetical protein
MDYVSYQLGNQERNSILHLEEVSEQETNGHFPSLLWRISLNESFPQQRVTTVVFHEPSVSLFQGLELEAAGRLQSGEVKSENER